MTVAVIFLVGRFGAGRRLFEAAEWNAALEAGAQSDEDSGVDVILRHALRLRNQSPTSITLCAVELLKGTGQDNAQRVVTDAENVEVLGDSDDAQLRASSARCRAMVTGHASAA